MLGIEKQRSQGSCCGYFTKLRTQVRLSKKESPNMCTLQPGDRRRLSGRHQPPQSVRRSKQFSSCIMRRDEAHPQILFLVVLNLASPIMSSMVAYSFSCRQYCFILNSFLLAHDSNECCWVSFRALHLFVVVWWLVLAKCTPWIFTACFVHGHLSTQAMCLQMPALRFLKILLKRATALGCAMCLRKPGSQPPELALPDVFAQNRSPLCLALQHSILLKGPVLC